VSRDGPALFRRYPALAARIPHHSFLAGVSPVERLVLEDLPGLPLWVKRDERCCPTYGGNKPRKLEFSLGSALARGARRVVTTGGLGTHHGLATAVLAREVGVATTLVLVDQPVTPHVRESLLLFLAFGAEVVHGRGVPGAGFGVLRSLARSALRGERPQWLPTGGSSAAGNLGFVSAGLELAEQVAAGALPEPAAIYVPVGSGGTLAGLVLGLRLAGVSSRPVGVLVTDILPPTPAGLAWAARRSLALLRRADPSVPKVPLAPAEFALARGQLGPGYGAATPAAEEAARAAGRSGLSLETTYTAKCLAEIRERARSGGLPPGPILFWNTKNAVDVAARAPRRADPAELPASIRRLLAERKAGAVGSPAAA
jgi:D-cysteine desulfhydrase